MHSEREGNWSSTDPSETDCCSVRECVRCHCVVLGMYCTVVYVSVLFFVNRRVTRCQQLASNPTLRCTVGALLLLIVNNSKTSAVFKQERGWRWWWLVMRKVLQRKVWKAFSKPPAAREGGMRMKFSSFSFFLLHSPFFPMIARLEKVGSDLTGALNIPRCNIWQTLCVSD